MKALVKGTGWGFPYMVLLKPSKTVVQSEGRIVEHTLDPWISKPVAAILAIQGSGERYWLGLSIHGSIETKQNSGAE